MPASPTSGIEPAIGGGGSGDSGVPPSCELERNRASTGESARTGATVGLGLLTAADAVLGVAVVGEVDDAAVLARSAEAELLPLLLPESATQADSTRTATPAERSRPSRRMDASRVVACIKPYRGTERLSPHPRSDDGQSCGARTGRIVAAMAQAKSLVNENPVAVSSD